MKKVLLLLSFVAIAGFTAQAQCGSAASAGAPKACCAGKIAKAMSADPNIEKRMSDDGSVSYVRKETDSEGTVKFVSVRFDEPTASFVNVAPPSALGAGAADGFVKKSCGTSAESTGKGCCAGKAAAGKSCCASKSGGATHQ